MPVLVRKSVVLLLNSLELLPVINSVDAVPALLDSLELVPVLDQLGYVVESLLLVNWWYLY